MGSKCSNIHPIDDIDLNSYYCDTFFNSKKQEAVKELSKYKKTNNFKDIENAFRLDNTNSDICYNFLLSLKESNKNEYQIIYPYVKFFIHQEQIKELEKDDPFALKKAKEYFNDILNGKINESEVPKLYNPYYLQFTKKEKNQYFFIDHFSDPAVHVCTLYDISPTFPLLSSNEEHIYNHYLGELMLLNYSTKDPEFLSDIFNVINSIRDIISPFQLCRLLTTFLSTKNYSDSIACCKNLLEEYSINSVSLKFCGNEDDEINLIVKRNIKFNKYIKEISKLQWRILKPILQSKCISSLLSFLFKKTITMDESVLTYIKESIQYQGLFNTKLFGYTNGAFLKIYINTMQRNINEVNCLKNLNLLFHFGSWIVTAIHEIVGHFCRRFFFYNSNKNYGNTFTPREQSIYDDGGNFIEYLLFKSQKSLQLSHIIYLLDIKNWNVDYSDFAKTFSSINNESETLVKSFLKKEYYSNNKGIIKQILQIGNRDKEEYENLIKTAKHHPRISISNLTRSTVVVDSENKDIDRNKKRSFYQNKWCTKNQY